MEARVLWIVHHWESTADVYIFGPSAGNLGSIIGRREIRPKVLLDFNGGCGGSYESHMSSARPMMVALYT